MGTSIYIKTIPVLTVDLPSTTCMYGNRFVSCQLSPPAYGWPGRT